MNTSRLERPSLVVMGVHSATEAYPNTKYAIAGLRERFHVTEINAPMFRIGEARGRLAQTFGVNIVRALWAHSKVIVRGLGCICAERMYIPYPAVPLMFLLSFMPSAWRPRRIVIDAFISWYDTVVNDRGYLAQGGVPARLLRWAERRAFAAADVVVVDTQQNAEFYAKTLVLPADKFAVVPLATNEVNYAPASVREVDGFCRVLFVGTLIPLHGIGTIVEAARLLSQRRDIRILVVGNGQERGCIESAIDQLGNIEWHRDWVGAEALSEAVRGSDICLGIFGSGAKTQRVCPYKVYAYASVGRAVITASTRWVDEASLEFGDQPFACVPAGDAKALASAIERLADDPGRRSALAHTSRRFYQAVLCNRLALDRLAERILGSVDR